MSEIQVNSLTKGVIVDGLPNPSAIYINPITKKPWTSVQEFLDTADDSLIDLVPYMVIRVGLPGNSKEYHNPNGGNNFIVKEEGGGTSSSGESAVYIIKAADWNLTEGAMAKDASGHYTTAQYTSMYNNGQGISSAIVYAKENGYSKAILESGTYYFCLAQGLEKRWNRYRGLPCITLTDINDFEFDLNGSILQLALDSSQKSQYYKEASAGASYAQAGNLVSISYCRNFKITNGTLLGDRFQRSYMNAEESKQEQTYGIQIGNGCKNLHIDRLHLEGFMGDGICGGGFVYYAGHGDSLDNVTNYCEVNYKQVPVAKRENTWYAESSDTINLAKAKQSGSCDATCVTGFIDLDTLYQDTCGLANRQADKEARRFQLFCMPGQARMVDCYPFNIGILTYTSNAADATPLRYFESAYQQPFELASNERYIRIQFSKEPNIADEFSTGVSYAIGDVVSKEVDSLLFQYECIGKTSGTFDGSKWKRVKVVGANSSESYSTSTTYLPGDIVTHAMGNDAYGNKRKVGYKCKTACSGTWNASNWTLIESDAPFMSTYQSLLCISEYQTYGLFISRCEFINSHRGNLANIACDTIVEDCTFYKHWKMANDGFPAPNPGSNMECTTMPWSTIYNVDLEDYYACNVKFIRCKFDKSGNGTGKVLLGCMSVAMDNCSGVAPVVLYSMSSMFINNCEFYGFSLELNAFNPAGLDTGARFLTRDVFVTNSKLVTNSFTTFQNIKGSHIVIENNVITTYSSVGASNCCDNKESADYIFNNNKITYIREAGYSDEGCNARVFNNNTITTKSRFNFQSPLYGLGSKVQSNQVNFGQYQGNLDVRDIVVEAGLTKIGIVETSTHKSILKFKNVVFNWSEEFSINLYIKAFNNQRVSGQTIDVYFENCEINSKCKAGNVGVCGFENKGSGDKVQFHFINTKFNTATNMFVAGDSVNDTFSCVECTDCTFNRDIYIGSTKIENSDFTGGSIDAYTKSESDSKYQPKGSYLTETQADSKYQPKGSSSGLNISDLQDNLKTINGNSLVGSGDMQIVAPSPELDNYLTTEQCMQAFLQASNLKTINGQSVIGTGNISISTTEGSVEDPSAATAIYPLYEVKLFQAVSTPQLAFKKTITDFQFQAGKKYKIDVFFEEANPYHQGTISLSHQDGSGTEQKVMERGQEFHGTFIANEDYDKIFIYYGYACDTTLTISYEDTVLNLVSGAIAEDGMATRDKLSKVMNIADLNRKFITEYKFACMGDSITSTQVSGIGSLVSQYLGCKLIDNYACGSATLTNGDNYVQSVAVANNTSTPYNTLTNQVIRLLQRTTATGQQITWKYTGTNTTYTIPTDVAVGLGYTEDIPDIVYIAIGINDATEKIGDDADTVLTQDYADLDKKTFASALRWTIETLRCAYPKVQIFVATPLFTGSSDLISTYCRATVLKKRDAILRACVDNSVYCIDSTMKSGYTNQIANTTIGQGAEGIHPKSRHKCMIAKFLAKEIYNNYIPEIPEEEIIY